MFCYDTRGRRETGVPSPPPYSRDEYYGVDSIFFQCEGGNWLRLCRTNRESFEISEMSTVGMKALDQFRNFGIFNNGKTLRMWKTFITAGLGGPDLRV